MNIGVMVGIVFMLMGLLCECIFILAWTPNFSESLNVIYFMVIGFAFTQSVSNSQIRGMHILMTKFNFSQSCDSSLTVLSIISIHKCSNIILNICNDESKNGCSYDPFWSFYDIFLTISKVQGDLY